MCVAVVTQHVPEGIMEDGSGKAPSRNLHAAADEEPITPYPFWGQYWRVSSAWFLQPSGGRLPCGSFWSASATTGS